MEENNNFVKDFFDGKLDYVSFMKCFSHLNLGEKKEFDKKITKLIDKYLELENFRKCEEKGHDFGIWNTRKTSCWNGLEDGMPVKDHYYIEYYRICENCGFEEKAFKEPEEYHNQQIKKEISEHKEAIKKLEKKLK